MPFLLITFSDFGITFSDFGPANNLLVAILIRRSRLFSQEPRKVKITIVAEVVSLVRTVKLLLSKIRHRDE